MGNCFKSQRAAASWADDDEWGEEEEQHQLQEMAALEKMERVEVKIRVTRQQLQELLEKAAAGEGKGRQVEKMLAEMISSGKVCYEQEAAGHWSPSLQSIPEADES
ncbi:hypothetical protein ABZP36_027800 [Zizania latifolia]